ncbi:putative linoleate 9S-lipoxygenase 5, partial [Bienertia sinuspersici]
MLMKWERVYDYAYYNDLGNPEKGPEYVRHVLGGSDEYPYPRRGRTSRPPTSTDPETETRLSLLQGTDIYIPRDEKFGHIKLSDFFGDTVKSLTQGIFGMLDSVFDWTPKEFDSLKDVMDMHEGAITLPDSASLNFLRGNVPTKFLQALFRSDGAALMNYPMPDIVKVDKSAWKTDEEFARQMLAGIHPLVIRRLEEFPPVSKLDPEVYGNQNSSITKECIEGNLDGLSVDEAIVSNRLYILDHHDTVMPFLKDINTKTSSRVYATRTLLFLRKDGTLKPLVIELSLPESEEDQCGAISKLYTPANEGVEASLWWLAKTYVSINDAAYHQLISHWLHTHAVIEPFIIAANRQLSKLHPVHKLLHPHFRDTMPVNTIARQIALNAKGLFEQAVYTRQYVGEWTSALYKDWKLTDQALPRDLIKRGMAVKDGNNGYKLLIEDYPYAVDGLEIWSAIETWVKTYCSFYYKSDDMVANDPELQSWWTEIREVGHGDKKDETWWPKMKTLNELIETCTTIIWVASALHAVLNFGQYPYGGYMPNRPTISRKFMPEPNEYDKLEKDPERVFLETVTSQLRTMVCISVIELISRHSEDEVYLGQREAGWTSDEAPIKALEEFNMKLDEIEAKILERNRNPEFKNRVGPAMLPFTLLCRSSEVGITGRGIPNSVSLGMAVKDGDNGYKLLIEDYPYAVDGLEIWSAIETWVKTYCSFYYKSDDMVANDPELQSWWTEIREVGHGDKKDETWWPKMKTLNELIETCTTIIWVASALHAVLNFGQYPYGGYMPNRPTISRKFMPEPNEYDKLEKDPERVFLETVTSQLRTMVCISMIELISRHSEDEVYLGKREAGWTSDDAPIKALEEFNTKLDEIEANILKRNKNPELKNRVGPAMLPFTLLCRSSEVGITGR